MNRCPRCGEINPAEVHTCTPGYHFTYKGKEIRDLSIDENQEMIEEYEKRKLKIMF